MLTATNRRIILSEITHKQRVLAAAVFAIIGSMTIISVLDPSGRSISAYAQSDSVAAPDSNPYGAPYEEWAARYWQWLLSVSSDVNPVFDQDGITCDENQPEGDVWFLIGESEGIRERTCSVPEGKAIFMPIIAVECDTATDDTLATEEEFATCVEEALGNVTKIEATIDGTPISGLEDHRVRSGLFEAQVPELNILAGEGTVKMMTEGYWLMINPLPQGEHVVELRAEVTPDTPEGDEPEPPGVTSVKYIAAVGTEATPIAIGATPPPPTDDNPVDETPDDNTPIVDDEDTQQPNQPAQQQQPSGCLIATATFGSELTPQVQYLRSFRENYILSTNTGSAFMNTFNTVYYSFSPQVADYEREQPWMQQTVKTGIFPLFAILGVSEWAFWAADGGDLGSIVAGMTASLLIGAVYLSPVLAVAKPLQRKLKLNKTALTISAVALSTSAIALGVSAYTGTLLEVSTPAFVVVITAISAIVVSKLWWNIAAVIGAVRRKRPIDD